VNDIYFISVGNGNFNVVTSAYLTVAFFVQDCEGLIDRNSQITYKGFSSRTWCGDIMKSDEEMMVGDSLVLVQDIYKLVPCGLGPIRTFCEVVSL
jgi:hypothetical protein